MKKNLTLASYILFAFALVFTACKGDDSVSPEQEKLNALDGTWTITEAVTTNGSVALSGVEINFNAENNSYAVTGLPVLVDNNLNHSDVIGTSGTISLNENLDIMTLTPGKAVNFVVTESALTLTYNSSFPKATDPEASIVLSATKQ